MSAHYPNLPTVAVLRLQRLQEFHVAVVFPLARDELVVRLTPPLRLALRHGALHLLQLLLPHAGCVEHAALLEQTPRCRPRNQNHPGFHWAPRQASQRHPKMFVWHVQSDVVRPMWGGLRACGEDAGWFLQNRNGLSA